MTEPKPTPKRSIAGALRLTHLGLWAERITQAFWPAWTAMFIAVAIWASGVVPPLWEVSAVALAGLAALGFFMAGLWDFRAPTRADALKRLDQTLPGRPLTALTDAMATGGGDPATAAVWQAHRRRMADRLAAAKPVPGNLRLADRDPYALRYMAVLVAAIAVMFGTFLRAPDLPGLPGRAADPSVASGPDWEGWLEPPRYTGLPTLYLNDIDPGTIEVPTGTRVVLRLYGQVGDLAVSETVSGRTETAPSEPIQDFTVTQSGTLAIDGADVEPLWTITAAADLPPEVTITGDAEYTYPDGVMIPWESADDFGVTAAEITIALNPDGLDRAHGLMIEPEPRDALTLDMALPIRGDRSAVAAEFRADLTDHPLAGMPVTVSMTATDAAGQIGTATRQMELAGRAFYDPIAAALIEQRRDLYWSRANRTRAARLLRAVTWRADDSWNAPAAYIITRMAIRRLDEGPLTLAARDEVAEMLWEAAVRIEDGSLDSALARLREAQERLAEAIRQGASPEEIQRLMAEMRQAMDDYTRQLARQQGQEGQQQQQAQGGESQTITPDMLDEMMRRIEELMAQGRTAEAQELLRQLQEMMENLQVTQGQGGGQPGEQGQGEQAMDDLRDQLRDQQELSDDAFRRLQEQFGQQQGQQGQQGQEGQQPGQQGQGQQGQQPGQQGQGQGQAGPGQPGQQGPGQRSAEPGQGGPEQGETGQGRGQGDGRDLSARGLAERQQALREGLQALRDSLPGAGSEAGDAAREALDRAEEAMRDAERDLAEGNLGGALDDQSRAMDALRDGMQELGRALAGDRPQPGQGQDEGQSNAQSGRAADRDPLGRQSGDGASVGGRIGIGDGAEGQRRARELVDEIRRRSGERDRPQIELDYLERLLDRF